MGARIADGGKKEIWFLDESSGMRPRKKLQHANSKHQRNTKLQAPNTARRTLWSLVLRFSLELGCWSLELWTLFHSTENVEEPETFDPPALPGTIAESILAAAREFSGIAGLVRTVKTTP